MRPSSVWGAADAPPTWLAELGTDRPLVYLTSGTEPAATGAPWAAALEALGNFDVDALATIGGHLDPATLGPIPPNVRVERFVPQQFVLDRATVVMSHAGAGSLLGATANGVPQLLNPIWADQWENADAATGAGVAITCELDQRSASDIATALERVLHEPRFADAASRVADEVAAMPEPVDHVATIEALATGSS
jgi:UDP:flavonoid glycosyltransferase YjiC (YdhE family)